MDWDTCKIAKSAKIGDNVRLEPYCVIGEDCEIGEGSIIGSHAVLRPGTKIGKYTIFGTGSVSEGDNEIGDYVTIHAQCHITSLMTICDRVFIAPFFCQANTPFLQVGQGVRYGSKKSHKPRQARGVIGEGTVIGVGVQVVPGVHIGEYCRVDMGTLITRDVMPHSIVRGRPGEIIGTTMDDLIE